MEKRDCSKERLGAAREGRDQTATGDDDCLQRHGDGKGKETMTEVRESTADTQDNSCCACGQPPPSFCGRCFGDVRRHRQRGRFLIEPTDEMDE
uniref:Uncharacterized protein n=1 Tax=Panagrellus redivivus TaxID=6233 RepID=A0A7E4VKZ4_PANRE